MNVISAGRLMIGSRTYTIGEVNDRLLQLDYGGHDHKEVKLAPCWPFVGAAVPQGCLMATRSQPTRVVTLAGSEVKYSLESQGWLWSEGGGGAR
jgi:hypothetical protein